MNDPISIFNFTVPLDDDYTNLINIKLNGHKVGQGNGYTGSLLCTGLTHWLVGELTAKFIGIRSSNFKGKHILELGCGLGLCGITAAKFVGDNGSVLLTDGDEEVIDIAASNVLINDVQSTCKTINLKWSDEAKLLSILESRGGRRFDIIIASDCLYSDCINQAKILFKVVSMLLLKDDENVIKTQVLSLNEEKEGNSNGGGWFDSESMSESNLRPVFVLGFTRRVQGSETSIDQILEIADQLGFEWTIAKDSVIDMFGNETSERTLMWEHCVFLFTWKD